MFRSDFGAFPNPSGVLQSTPSSMGALPSMNVEIMRRPAWAATSRPIGACAAGPALAVRDRSIPAPGRPVETSAGAPRAVAPAPGARGRQGCRRRLPVSAHPRATRTLRKGPATGGGSARTPPPVAPTTRWRGGGTRNHSRGPAPARHAPQVRAETTSGDGDCPPRPHTNARDGCAGIGRGAAPPVERYRPATGLTSRSGPPSLTLLTFVLAGGGPPVSRRAECPARCRPDTDLSSGPAPDDEETVDTAGLTGSLRPSPGTSG